MRTIRNQGRLACSAIAIAIAQADAAASQEFEIPAEWLEKAAAEGAIDFSTNDAAGHVAKWLPVFQARYPEIELVATETSGAARAVQPLLAYKSGRLVRHVLVSFESSLADFVVVGCARRPTRG